jgi:hypothetical protein
VNQRNATVKAVLSVLSERGVGYELNGEVTMSEVFTSGDKEKVIGILCEGFESGMIDMSEQARGKYIGNGSELRKYVVGLINNWVRKAPEFNHGGKYIPTQPGSRSSDETLKALRTLAKTVSDPVVLNEINEAIRERTEELKPTAEINVSALPEHLRHLVR